MLVFFQLRDKNVSELPHDCANASSKISRLSEICPVFSDDPANMRDDLAVQRINQNAFGE